MGGDRKGDGNDDEKDGGRHDVSRDGLTGKTVGDIARPTNAEIIERLARCNRQARPSVADTVAEIR